MSRVAIHTPLLGRHKLYRVRGHSLYPLLKDGQTIFLSQHVNTLNQGDVIVFEHPFRKQRSIKRIKHIDPDGTVTVAGTIIESEDAIGAIHPKHIVGKVMSVI